MTLSSATELAPTAHETAIAAAAGANQLSTSLLAVPVTPANMQWATDTAKQVRDYRKQLENQMAAGVKPLLGVVETIRGWFRDPLAVCDQVYAHLTGGVAAVMQAERAAQRLALEAAAASGAGQEEIKRAVDAAAPRPSGTRETTYYSARVLDAAKVPAMFRVIDQKALDAHARATKEAFAVDGCELVRDTRVVPV
jgi:hypothetical protein